MREGSRLRPVTAGLLPKSMAGYDPDENTLWVVARSRGARGRAPSRRCSTRPAYLS